MSVSDSGLSALTPIELRELSKQSAARTWLRVANIWLSILSTLGLVAWLDTWWAMALAVPFIARHQLALGGMMHDAAHRRLFSSRVLNDTVSQLLLAGPLMLISDGYRRTHLKHHRRTLHEDDPDIGISGGYPISGRRLWVRLLRDISGQTYIKFVRHFILPSRRTAKVAAPIVREQKSREGVPLWLSGLGILGVHGALFTGLWAIGAWWWYPVLWLIPQASFLQVFLRIRGIAEHAAFQPSTSVLENTRTVINVWQTWWVAPANLNYHISHHLHPSIPWFNLPKVHRILLERGHLEGAHIHRGYGTVIQELLSESLESVGASQAP